MKKISRGYIRKYVMTNPAEKAFDYKFESLADAERATALYEKSVPTFQPEMAGDVAMLSGIGDCALADMLGVGEGELTDAVISVKLVKNLEIKFSFKLGDLYDAKTQLQERLDKAQVAKIDAALRGIKIRWNMVTREYAYAFNGPSEWKEGRATFVLKDVWATIKTRPTNGYGAVSQNKAAHGTAMLNANGVLVPDAINGNDEVVVKHPIVPDAGVPHKVCRYDSDAPEGFTIEDSNEPIKRANNDGSLAVDSDIPYVNEAFQGRKDVLSKGCSKFCCSPMNNVKKRLQELIAELGLEDAEFRDAWGTAFDPMKKSVWSTDKVMKLAACFNNHEEIVDRGDGDVRIMNYAHVKRDITWYAQALQYLVAFDDDDLKAFIRPTIDSLYEKAKTRSGVAAMIGGDLGIACEALPELFAYAASKRIAESAFQVATWRAAGGAIVDHDGIECTIMCDPKLSLGSMLLTAAGKNISYEQAKAISLLHEGEVFSWAMDTGVEYIVNRAPSASVNAWGVVRCVTAEELDARDPNWRKYFADKNLVYVNNLDNLFEDLQWDFDADKCKFSKNKYLLKAVKDTKEYLGAMTVVQAEGVPTNTKKVSMAEAMLDAFRNNKVGIASNIQFKLFNHNKSWVKEHLDLTYAAAIYIYNAVDSTKLGSLGRVPEELKKWERGRSYRVSYVKDGKEVYQVYFKKQVAQAAYVKLLAVAEKNGATDAKLEVIGELRPWSTAFQIATLEEGRTPADLAENYEEEKSWEESGICDKIAKIVLSETDDLLDELKWMDDEYGRDGDLYRIITANPDEIHVHPGLWKNRKYNAAGDIVDEGGYFQQIFFSDSLINRALFSEDEYDDERIEDLKTIKKFLMFNKVIWMCEQAGVTMEQAADEIAKRLMCDEHFDNKAYGRFGWMIFGQIWLKNIAKNVPNKADIITELADADDLL